MIPGTIETSTHPMSPIDHLNAILVVIAFSRYRHRVGRLSSKLSFELVFKLPPSNEADALKLALK